MRREAANERRASCIPSCVIGVIDDRQRVELDQPCVLLFDDCGRAVLTGNAARVNVAQRLRAGSDGVPVNTHIVSRLWRTSIRVAVLAVPCGEYIGSAVTGNVVEENACA